MRYCGDTNGSAIGEVPHRIVGQFFLDARIDGEAGHAAEKDRRAVGLGVGGEAGADHLRGARLVVDHEGLAGPLRQHVRHGTWQNVSDAAGGIGYDDGDDPVVLRRRSRRPEGGRQRRHGKGAGKRGGRAEGRELHGGGVPAGDVGTPVPGGTAGSGRVGPW